MKNLLFQATLPICVLLAAQLPLYAQGVMVSANIQELAYAGKLYHGVLGSPFLYDSWNKGSVQFRDGSLQEGLNLKYDQVEDKLLFSPAEGQVQQFAEPVTEFTLPASPESGLPGLRRFRSGYAPIDGASETSFYEILADGPTQLVKRTSKKIVEELAPNSNIIKTKQVKQKVKYYFVRAGELIPISKDKKNLIAALQDKGPAMEQYLKKHKLTLEDTALVLLTTYYNSL